jgi:Ribbon-helix-helix protein, copG family
MKKRTSLSLPEKLLRELDREAVALGLSRSAYVTALLESRASACLGAGAGQQGRARDPEVIAPPKV